METIVFIGVNKAGSSREAIKAAKRLGYYTVLFTDRKKQLIQRGEYPDVHQMILTDIADLKEMRRHLKKLQQRGHEICLITSFTGQNVYTASLLADEYCHNIVSTESIGIMENKEKTRTFFKDDPFTPNFIVLPFDKEVETILLDKKLSFPVMVKSPQSTGSKDAILTEDEEQLHLNVKTLRELYPEETIIIEEFIVGKQYLVEVAVYKSKLNLIAVIEQEITKGIRLIVTGYGVMANYSNGLEREVLKVVNVVINKLGIENGALHLEMRLTNTGMKLIEVNPRISGGAMNDMIEAAFGYSLVEETLKIYLSKTPSFEKIRNLSVYTKHVTVPRQGFLERVTGKERAKRSQGVVKVYVKPKKGTFLIPPISMGHRYAYVIAAAPSVKQAEKLAVKAAKEIKFHLKEEEKDIYLDPLEPPKELQAEMVENKD